MRKYVMALVVLALVAASGTALAQDTHRFKIYGAMAYVSPLSEEDVDIGAISDSVEASSEAGWMFGFEWRWGKLFGLEIDYINSTQDIEFGGDTIAEVDFAPISASLNFHLIHGKYFDFYLAPTISYIYWGDIEASGSTLSGDIDTDTEFAYGAQVGLDIGIGETFLITGGIRWLSADLSPEDGDDIGVDPLISRLGVGLRF